MKSSHLKRDLLKICTQPRTFEYVSKKMGGLDPIKIMNLLEHLKDENLIQESDGYWMLIEKKEDTLIELDDLDSKLWLKQYMGHFEFLKNPHPLDFEWRNTLKSLNYLTDLIQEINASSDRILLLGMPTLFANCSLHNIPQEVTLVERNTPIIKGLKRFCNSKAKIRQDDIFKVEPKQIGKFDCIVMDPPWYSNFLYQFVWLASQCLIPGGILVISIPPINTRENIGKERIQWFTYCEEQGLCIQQLLPEKLEYAMPFFEFNAFRQAGVNDLSPFWRKGDLVFLKKIQQSPTQRPTLDLPSDNWQEVEFDNVRIRVNLEKDNFDYPIKIKSIIKGDILPSVSRSSPKRKKANVWTSGNRIFTVNNPKHFFDELNNIKNHEIQQWKDIIVNLEEREYRDYLKNIYYEMERSNL
jgi:hypothetical protein